jgi:hypothetical protein
MDRGHRAFDLVKEVEMVFSTIVGAVAFASIGSLWVRSGRRLATYVREGEAEA